MPDEWKTSVTVPIFKGKGDVMSCGSYREVKLLEHAMKIVEKVLQRRIRTLIILNEMQFGFMPGKETMHAIFIVRKMQEKYQKKDKKLYLCFVEMEKVAVAVAVAATATATAIAIATTTTTTTTTSSCFYSIAKF